jgi:hypothetical protein
VKTLLFASLLAMAVTAPAYADPEDGRLYEEPSQQYEQENEQGKSGKWYGGVRQGFDNRDRWGGYYESRQGFERHTTRRGFESRENWLDGEAFALLDRWAMWNFDYDRDGRLSRREYERSQQSFWGAADRNRDGRVSNGEYRNFRDRHLRRDFNRGYANGWHNGWRW